MTDATCFDDICLMKRPLDMKFWKRSIQNYIALPVLNMLQRQLKSQQLLSGSISVMETFK